MNKTEYESILENELLEEAACITWVRALSPSTALQRFGATKPFTKRTLNEIDNLMMDNTGFGVISGHLSDEWTILIEPNGYLGTETSQLLPLSKGTEAISIFWNINGLSRISYVKDGESIAAINDVVMFLKDEEDDFPIAKFDEVEGNNPDFVKDLIEELSKVEDFDWETAAFKWVYKQIEIGLPVGWLNAVHESAMID